MRRTRRFFRRRPVRVASAVIAVFLVFVMFSAGQAAFRNNGQGFTANLAEWARDHYLGPVVTFGEWVSYNPPPKGGNPSFSLAVPSGEALTPSGPAKAKAKNAFVPDIPATLKSLAGSSIAGEGPPLHHCSPYSVPGSKESSSRWSSATPPPSGLQRNCPSGPGTRGTPWPTSSGGWMRPACSPRG